MKKYDTIHPITSFIYFALVISITMFTFNPVMIVISYISSILFDISLKGFKKALKDFLYMIPIIIIIAITNPIFNSRGKTILFFLNDNPFTLEALIYGVFSSLMIVSIFNWFKCFSVIITSDKFIYLFGRIMPKTSLVLCLILTFIPRLKKKAQEIEEAQKGLGIYQSVSKVDKIKNKLRVFSILITNALETSIDTADSMRARGYGLKKRSSYSIFHFTKDDLINLLIFLTLGISVIVLIFTKSVDYAFYPTFTNVFVNNLSMLTYILFAMLTLISSILELKEVLLWHYLKSKI